MPFFQCRCWALLACVRPGQGFGTRLMNHVKEAVKRDGVSYFVTYADNYAVGYFQKQVCA